LFFKPLLYFCPFPVLFLSIFSVNATNLRLFAIMNSWLEFSPSPTSEKIRLPTPFAPAQALCGAAWQRSAVFLRLQAAFRAPPKTIVPIVYLPFGESLQAACVCFFYRLCATDEAAFVFARRGEIPILREINDSLGQSFTAPV
jgi:hypothetical protein